MVARERERAQIVGRERECALLDDRLGAALAGSGQVVLVAGEPGVGKTRLAEEAAALAKGHGMAVAWGRASDDGGSPPYWPWLQVLRRVGLPDLTIADEAPPERFARFESVAEGLREAAEPGGLLLVLDDLHWADPASLRLLAHVAAGLADTPLVVLGTYRDTETVTLGELRNATRLHLGGLAPAEVGAQLAGVTGWTVPDSVAAAVHRRTRGNPFFVAELGRVLATSADAGLPDGIRDAVRARLARLSTPARTVVAAASVVGGRLGHDKAGTAPLGHDKAGTAPLGHDKAGPAPLGHDKAGPVGAGLDPVALAAITGLDLEAVLTALDEATRAGIVTDARFTHDLIREVAQLDVATAEKLRLHQRMAEHLTAAGGDQRVEELAHHWLASLPTGDAVAAVAWAERAAARAMAQQAWEQADLLLARAVAAATGPRFGPADRCRLLLARAQAQVRAYDMSGARHSVLAVADLARGLGDWDSLARAVLCMDGANDFLWDPINRALAEEALTGIGDADSAVRVRLLAQLAASDTWRTLDAAEARSAEALAMADRLGERQALREALRARHMTRSGPDGVHERLALADRLLAIGIENRDDDAVLWGRLWRFDAFAQLGEIGRAEAELDPIEAVAARLRSPLARWHATRYRATIALARGRFADATRLGRDAEAIVRRAGHDGARVPTIGLLILVWMQTVEDGLDADEAYITHRELYGGIGDSPATTAFHGGLAIWNVMIGRRAEAERIYRLLPPVDATPPFMLLPVLGAAAELAFEFADRTVAEDVRRRLTPFAELQICGGAGIIAIGGSAHTALGLAAATLDRLDDAVRHLRSALDVNDRAGLPPSAAMTRLHLARVLVRRRRPGDRDEAAALATAAAARAEQLGMAPLRRRARELADSLTGRQPGPLTERERQIAELVAQGLTNRQIAATARISERTAATHVQHILTKLGFTNRTQIAGWVRTSDT